MEQQLFDACLMNQVEEVKQLLNNPKIDPNHQGMSGRTPFFVACARGNLEVVKVLLDNVRVDVNRVDPKCRTPFYVACEKGHHEVVKLLLNEERVDINKGDKNGQPPLLVACQKEQKEVVKILLSDERIEREKKKEYGAPFYVACLSEKFEIVQHFFVNEKNKGRIDNIEKVNEDKNKVKVNDNIIIPTIQRMDLSAGTMGINLPPKIQETDNNSYSENYLKVKQIPCDDKTVILPPTAQRMNLSARTMGISLPPKIQETDNDSDSENNSGKFLVMRSLNNTFEKRSFTEEDFPLVLGRGKNSTKGLFDSQVISRNHAEIVFMKNKVLISSPFSLV